MSSAALFATRLPDEPAERPLDRMQGVDSMARRPDIRRDNRFAAGGRRASRARSLVEVSADPIGRHAPTGLPCQIHDPDLWFAETPDALESAKALCAGCPARLMCLAGALDRREACGVWGGQIFDRGRIVDRKRPPGRPRKDSAPVLVWG
jgi:WhiB family transcriptional regulator, redox-sensing transcriptional regulator